MIRTAGVGVCGTDREIVRGHEGAPPHGRRDLIIGHEVVGQVYRADGGFERGEWVTATIRRPCGRCGPCGAGAYDSCATALPPERGIERLDGFAAEVFAEDPGEVIRVPASLGFHGVLAEPMSVCERGLRHAIAVGSRQHWDPRRAVVFGTGAIGTLSAALLRLRDLEVWVAGRRPVGSPQVRLVTALGAEYLRLAHDDLASALASICPDIVIEATGAQWLLETAVAAPASNGVVCLLGLNNHPRGLTIAPRALSLDYVLGNRALIGSVNAKLEDWATGLDDLVAIERRWPGMLDAIVDTRLDPVEFELALEHQGVKAVLDFGTSG